MENSESLHEHYSFSVQPGQEPLRIDKYLMNFVENATRTKIQAAAKDGSIRVNGQVVKSNYKVRPLDEIKVFFEYRMEVLELMGKLSSQTIKSDLLMRLKFFLNTRQLKIYCYLKILI